MRAPVRTAACSDGVRVRDRARDSAMVDNVDWRVRRNNDNVPTIASEDPTRCLHFATFVDIPDYGYRPRAHAQLGKKAHPCAHPPVCGGHIHRSSSLLGI